MARYQIFDHNDNEIIVLETSRFPDEINVKDKKTGISNIEQRYGTGSYAKFLTWDNEHDDDDIADMARDEAYKIFDTK